jgi:hypothetical protein
VGKGLFGERSFSAAACPDFEKVFASISAEGVTSKGKVVFDGCQYQKLGLMTADEFAVAGGQDFSSAMLAPPLFRWMVDHGVASSDARALIRKTEGL